MSSINRNPLGWLGFLGIKNFGRNPVTASEFLAPTWDLSSLYLEAASRYSETAFFINAAGVFPVVTVPQNEVWYVLNMSVRSDVVTGATPLLQVACVISPQAGSSNVNVSQHSERITSLTGRAMAATSYPIIAQPGERLGAYCAEYSSAAQINCSLSLRYTILQA